MTQPNKGPIHTKGYQYQWYDEAENENPQDYIIQKMKEGLMQGPLKSKRCDGYWWGISS